MNRITALGLVSDAAEGKLIVVIADRREARDAFDQCARIAKPFASKIVSANGRESVKLKTGGEIRFTNLQGARGLRVDVVFIDCCAARDHELVREVAAQHPMAEIIRA